MILQDIQQVGEVLILGYGREGQSTEKFLRERLPEVNIEIVKETKGRAYTKALKHHTLVIKSPGISPHLKDLETAKKRETKFISATQIFFEECPGKIIGITGTKGKSTTASLTHHFLHSSGKTSVLVGNIGQPALDQLGEITSNTLVVFELSSHQLMDLNTAPPVAVLLNILPEHLDYYADFQEYQRAKLRITQFQTAADVLVYIAKNPDLVQEIERVSGAQNRFPLTPETITTGPWSKIPADQTPLKGKFNWENIAAAWTVCRELGLTNEQLAAGLKTFKPLEGRLELVGQQTFGGIFFYDDRLATIPEAAMAAIETLGDQVETILLGGSDRKQDFTELGKVVIGSHIKHVILFPDTGKRIWKAIQQANTQAKDIREYAVTSMDEAVRLAYAHTTPGKAVLMSNASPSFSLFKNYQDKAEQYQSAIKRIAELRSLPQA